MKKLLWQGLLAALIIGCSAAKSDPVAKKETPVAKNDTLRIANDELEYEVIIIEPGFDSWLRSVARPRNFYSLTYLETKNYQYVTEWNTRVNNPYRYSPNLYEMRIDYQPQIRYGYEVNYLLYNYFVYFQNHYKQKL